MATETLVLKFQLDATATIKTQNDLIKRNKQLAKLLRDAPKEGAEGFEELRESVERAKKEYAENRKEIVKFNREIRETDEAADSLKGLSRTLRKLEDEYKSLGKEQRNAIGGQVLRKQIQTVRADLKRLESDLGDNRRRVGEYGQAWQQTGRQITQLSRTARSTLNVVRFASLGAFQSLFDGVQFVTEAINTFSAAISPNIALNQRLRSVSEDVTSSFVEQKIELEGLIARADESNGTTEDSVAARQAIIDQFPDLLDGEEKQALLLGKTEVARRKATAALIENLAIEAQRKQLAKIIEELAQNELDDLQRREDAQSSFNQFLEGSITFGKNLFTLGNAELIEAAVGTELSFDNIQKAAIDNRRTNLTRQAQNIDKIGTSLKSSLTEISGVIESLNIDVAGAATGTDKAIEDARKNINKNVTIVDGSLADLEKQLSAVNEQINKTVEVGDTEALIPLIEESKTLEQEIKQAKDAIKDLRGELEETAEEQQKRLLKQAELLAKLTENEEEELIKRAELRKIARDKEINDLIRDEETKNEALILSAELLESQKKEIRIKAAEDRKKERDKEQQEAIDATNEAISATLERTILGLEEARNEKIKNDKTTAEERLSIEREFNIRLLEEQIKAEKNRLKIVEDGSKEQIAIKRNLLGLELKLFDARLEEEKAANKASEEEAQRSGKFKLDLKEEIEKAAFAVARTFADLAINLAKQQAQKEKDESLKALKEETEARLSLVAGNSQLEEQVKQQAAQREEEIERKAARKQKNIAIGQAIINGALGATKTIATLGLPLAIPALIALAVQTAASIAIIAGQKFERGGLVGRISNLELAASSFFQKGGIPSGPSHKDGGIKATVAGRSIIELEGGEAITNKKSTSRFANLLSFINQAEGGRRFAGTKQANPEIINKLDGLELVTRTAPIIAERGFAPKLTANAPVRRFQEGGVATIEGTEVRLPQNSLTPKDINQIEKACFAGTKKGIENARIFEQFKRQAEREIERENRSNV